MKELQKWGKIPQAAQYAGISVRTMRRWLENGLAHIRMDTGTILIKFEQVDRYLANYSVQKDNNVAIHKATNKIAREVGVR